MLKDVNIEQVKQFNASLKQYKDKAISLNAEIEYTNKEIDALCAELTSELGVTVTRDNVSQIYEEQVAKINSTLQSGNAVLAKIASEEAAQSAGQAVPVAPVTPVQAVPVTPVTPVAPVPPVPVAPVTPVAPAAPVGGQIFGNANVSDGGTLPPMFSLGQ